MTIKKMKRLSGLFSEYLETELLTDKKTALLILAEIDIDILLREGEAGQNFTDKRG